MFYWCTGDDHAVELLVAHFLESTIKHHHMLDGRVLRRMALKLHKVNVKLQRGVREQAYEIGLSSNLQRHKIEDDDT